VSSGGAGRSGVLVSLSSTRRTGGAALGIFAPCVILALPLATVFGGWPVMVGAVGVVVVLTGGTWLRARLHRTDGDRFDR
jgi:hypothetical protein